VGQPEGSGRLEVGDEAMEEETGADEAHVVEVMIDAIPECILLSCATELVLAGLVSVAIISDAFCDTRVV
jgi:hypothetical protein